MLRRSLKGFSCVERLYLLSQLHFVESLNIPIVEGFDSLEVDLQLLLDGDDTHTQGQDLEKGVFVLSAKNLLIAVPDDLNTFSPLRNELFALEFAIDEVHFGSRSAVGYFLSPDVPIRQVNLGSWVDFRTSPANLPRTLCSRSQKESSLIILHGKPYRSKSAVASII